MNHRTKQFLYAIGTSWTTLGFWRGLQSYEYEYNHQRDCSPYLYSKKIGYGIVGASIYICPSFYFIILPKEIYRCEVNIRSKQLACEKDTRYYNEIL